MSQIPLDQQVYARAKRGIVTVARSAGIKPDELTEIERRSQYVLPNSLMYEENCSAPVKYVFYQLGTERFVVGRAIYLGRDELGRPGNYLYHNLLIDYKDLATLDTNPARLTKALIAKGVFLDAAPDSDVLEAAQLDTDEEFDSLPTIEISDHNSLLSVLYASLNLDLKTKPILLKGSSENCLEFLLLLFDIIPYKVRASLAYDTYGHGMRAGPCVFGIPHQKEFELTVEHCATFDLETLRLESGLEIKEVSTELSLIVDMVTGSMFDELDTFYQLQLELERGDIDTFRQRVGGVPQGVLDYLVKRYTREVLRYIATNRDDDLLRMVAGAITVEDLKALNPDLNMLLALAGMNDARINAVVAEYLASAPPDESIYRVVLTSSDLWERFLRELVTDSSPASKLASLTVALSSSYSAEFEESLYAVMIPLIDRVMEDRRQASRLVASLAALPSRSGRGARANERVYGVEAVRAYVLYRLTSNQKYLASLLTGGLDDFPAEIYRQAAGVVAEGLFQFYESESASREIERLFSSSSHKYEFISQLTQIRVPGGSENLLAETVARLLQTLPPGKETDRAKALVEGRFRRKRKSWWR